MLMVSRAGFYAARRRPPSARTTRDQYLRLHVRTAYARSNRTYGAPRVRKELHDQGEPVATKRVARLMREDGLRARGPRRFVRTTDSTHAFPIAPNLLARQFAVEQVPALDRVWVSDLTYVPTREGWLFLAVVLDLASRRVVGWAMRETADAAVAVAALGMAVAHRRPAPGLVHHSDRGVQYACHEYRAFLTAHGLVASMSRRGNCWDNAVAESFFATLEFELFAQHDWLTRTDARADIFRYIETWYNRERRHSTLEYLSPVQYEEQLNAA
jgi:transposase InsO family protein